jgi:hypothetical protein
VEEDLASIGEGILWEWEKGEGNKKKKTI